MFTGVQQDVNTKIVRNEQNIQHSEDPPSLTYSHTKLNTVKLGYVMGKKMYILTKEQEF